MTPRWLDRTKAAIKTGDIDPKTAATMGQSAELAQMKIDSAHRSRGRQERHDEGNQRGRASLAMDHSAECDCKPLGKKAAGGAAEIRAEPTAQQRNQNIRATTALISTLTYRQVTSKEQKKDIREQIGDYRLDIEQSKGVRT